MMPPPTLPTHFPSGSISIFAPTSRGVEPWRETMVTRTGGVSCPAQTSSAFNRAGGKPSVC